MDLDTLTRQKPRRLLRAKVAAVDENVVDVGPGTKWQLPFKKKDIDALVSSETDIAAAVKAGGWKAGALNSVTRTTCGTSGSTRLSSGVKTCRAPAN